ncbi:hypothetical protein [Tunicatimonas pelagia]|uniref:hypothetical protein n=1 Tax=Tunicatimonas pelagia TaxID=931531 RepID=UPI0026655FD3|nr:hypothetical protein [Tunicatimonas pelagia]WKN41095.1 hypothetical protein P0M28_18850 [Tunicatimonas pelagia]
MPECNKFVYPEKYNVQEKYDCYRTLPSFREHLLVSSQKAEVEVRKKNADEKWETQTLQQPQQTIEILGCKLSLKEIYEDAAL